MTRCKHARDFRSDTPSGEAPVDLGRPIIGNESSRVELRPYRQLAEKKRNSPPARPEPFAEA